MTSVNFVSLTHNLNNTLYNIDYYFGIHPDKEHKLVAISQLIYIGRFTNFTSPCHANGRYCKVEQYSALCARFFNYLCNYQIKCSDIYMIAIDTECTNSACQLGMILGAGGRNYKRNKNNPYSILIL